MAEMTLNAPGFGATWATLRVESTQIGAQGGPAFPQLLMPLSVVLHPVEPKLVMGDYFPTPDDPIQHYSLLQLSGSLVVNSIPIGTFQTTPITLNSRNNQSGTVLILVPLDLFRIQYIEERRSGDVSLRLDITPWIAKHYRVARKEPLSGYEQFETNFHQLSVQVPQSHWIQNILPGLGYGRIHLIEVPIPATAIGEGLTKTVTELQHAQDAFTNGDYNKSLLFCRNAIELLSTIRPYVGEVKRPTFADKIDFLLEVLPGTPTGVRRENLARLLKDLWGFTSMSPHPSKLQFTRDDAQMTMLIVTAILSYMSHFVDAAQKVQQI